MIVSLALSLAMMAPVPYAPETHERPPLVRDWLALCDRNPKACNDYLFDLVWSSTVGPQKVGYCLPDKDPPEAITGRVQAWLRARPDQANKPTDQGLNRAMLASFPCR
jgi:hypothetical protein